MPYQRVKDLPREQVEGYDEEQKEIFRKAFNEAIEMGEDEDTAYEIAHAEVEEMGSGSRERGSGADRPRGEGARSEDVRGGAGDGQRRGKNGSPSSEKSRKGGKSGGSGGGGGKGSRGGGRRKTT